MSPEVAQKKTLRPPQGAEAFAASGSAARNAAAAARAGARAGPRSARYFASAVDDVWLEIGAIRQWWWWLCC